MPYFARSARITFLFLLNAPWVPTQLLCMDTESLLIHPCVQNLLNSFLSLVVLFPLHFFIVILWFLFCWEGRIFGFSWGRYNALVSIRVDWWLSPHNTLHRLSMPCTTACCSYFTRLLNHLGPWCLVFCFYLLPKIYLMKFYWRFLCLIESSPWCLKGH